MGKIRKFGNHKLFGEKLFLYIFLLDVNFKNITIELHIFNTHIHVDSENQLILKMPKLTHCHLIKVSTNMLSRFFYDL